MTKKRRIEGTLFDYGNTPLAGDDGGGIHDYLEALVREVRHRVEQHGLQAIQLIFKMPPDLWHEVACHYACLYNLDAPTTEVVKEAIAIKESCILVIDGVEYNVELDSDIESHTIYLVPDTGRWPTSCRGQIFNVGIIEDGDLTT